MQVPVSSHTVLRSFMAGAVLIFGASACSRPDRAETGSSNTAATTEDTAVSRATQDVPGTGQDRVAADTTTATSDNSGTGAAPGDTAPARMQPDAPRAATASPSRERGTRSTSTDSGAAGYRAIERDTAARPESDSARVTEDTSETSLNQADTAAVETAGAGSTSDTAATDTATAAGYVEMARDTTSGADQAGQIDTGSTGVAGAGNTTVNAGRVRPVEDSIETMGQVTGDTNVTAEIADSVNAAIGARGDDTTGNDGRVRPPEDSTELHGNATAAPTETPGDTTSQLGAEVGDTTMNAGRVRPVEDTTETLGQVTTDTSNTVAVTDSALEGTVAARGADTTENAGGIRPPEDSTELQGNVSAAESASVNAADTADEAPVAETPGSEVAAESADMQPAAAAAVAGTVTGADAVAMLSRQGGQCAVVDPETDEEVRWDMSSTPATLNPCGLGSMNLSKVWIKQ